MYFKPIEGTVEGAKTNAQAYFEKTNEYDEQLGPLYDKLHWFESVCDSQYYEEECELREEIHVLEDCADHCDRYYDYWMTQLRWAKDKLTQKEACSSKRGQK